MPEGLGVLVALRRIRLLLEPPDPAQPERFQALRYRRDRYPEFLGDLPARSSHQFAEFWRRECRRFPALGPEGAEGVLGSASRRPEGEGRESAVPSATAVATW
jgi:hypothetical protein